MPGSRDPLALKEALRALNDDVQELRREAARADGEDSEALREELAAFEPFRQLRSKRILRELVALEGRREPAAMAGHVRPPVADIRRMAPEIARALGHGFDPDPDTTEAARYLMAAAVTLAVASAEAVRGAPLKEQAAMKKTIMDNAWQVALVGRHDAGGDEAQQAEMDALAVRRFLRSLWNDD